MKNKVFKTDDIFTVNPIYFLRYILKKAPIVLVSAFFVSIIAYFFADKYEVVSYKAVAKIIRYDKKVSMPKDVPYKFQNFNYDTALQTIRTRENLEEAISSLGLNITVENIYSKYEIKRAKRSDIIEIIYTSNNKKSAVEGANTLAEIFLKNFYKVQNAATKEVLVYYKKQKQSLVKELDFLLSSKEKFHKDNNLLSIETEKDYKYEQLNEVSLNLIDTRVLKNEYETKITKIEQKLKQIPKEVQLEYSVRSADLKAIENKEKELAKLRQKYTKYNPKIKTLKNEIKKMRENFSKKKRKKNTPDEITYGNNPLYTALIIELSQSRIGVISSENRIQKLIEQKDRIEKQIKRLNDLEKKYSLIRNKIKEKNELLDLVTSRQNELKIALESTQEDFKFLERAKPPRYPETNYKKAIVLGSAFFTILVLIGFFILRLFLDFRIKEPFDIEKRFNIKLIGTFNNSDDEKISKKSSMNFLTNFMKNLIDKKVILVSSDVKNTGKSYILNKLTYFLSNTKQKTLYIQIVKEITEDIKDATIDLSNLDDSILANVNIIDSNIHKLYIQDSEKNDYYLANIKVTQKLFSLLKQSDYEFILIEVPSYDENFYFFKNFVLLSDSVLLVFKTKVSHRKKVDLLIKEINSLSVNQVKGVLNAI